MTAARVAPSARARYAVAAAALLAACAAVTASAAERTDRYDNLFNEGYEAALKQDHLRASRLFREAIAVKEAEGITDNSAYNALGWVLFSQGAFDEAEKQYLLGVDQERRNPPSLNRKLFTNIGVLYYSLGNLGKAEHYLDIAAERYHSESAERLRRKIRTVIEQKMHSDQRRAETEVNERLTGEERDSILALARHRIEISLEVGEYIGQKVWYNEGGGKESNLISWNRGEDHLSVGIAHFIWYPKGRDGPYTESFPALLERIEKSDEPIPRWLREDRDCPWSSREELLAAEAARSIKYTELMDFLKRTVPYQVAHLVERLNNALPTMLGHVGSPGERARIIENFSRVAKKPDGAPSPDGVYALLDYVNFKGEGTSPTERYRDQGWGLLDVLGDMSPDAQDPLQEFVDAAKRILLRRIANAPEERNESRWKNGWFNRLDTYLPS